MKIFVGTCRYQIDNEALALQEIELNLSQLSKEIDLVTKEVRVVNRKKANSVDFPDDMVYTISFQLTTQNLNLTKEYVSEKLNECLIDFEECVCYTEKKEKS